MNRAPDTAILRSVEKEGAQNSSQSTEADLELEQRFAAAYDENGVDRSLIRYSLSVSPLERLPGMEETLNALAAARRVTHPR